MSDVIKWIQNSDPALRKFIPAVQHFGLDGDGKTCLTRKERERVEDVTNGKIRFAEYSGGKYTIV
jgi:hypothetical protein